MPDTHLLKTWPVPFWDVVSGAKTFEVRRNDRDFKVGDYLMLKEYDPKTKRYSGEYVIVQVDYSIILPEPEGFIGMAISEVRTYDNNEIHPIASQG